MVLNYKVGQREVRVETRHTPCPNFIFFMALSIAWISCSAQTRRQHKFRRHRRQQDTITLAALLTGTRPSLCLVREREDAPLTGSGQRFLRVSFSAFTQLVGW